MIVASHQRKYPRYNCRYEVDSPSFGKHESVPLTGDNFLMLWVSSGFAHEFNTLEDDTMFFYIVIKYYNEDSELCLKWNDQALNINWNRGSPMVSEKDKEGLPFSELKGLF